MANSGEVEEARQNFTCSCCCDLMVDPTTLTCGHSFCRLCLAHWWCTSRSNQCLYCRQPWHGYPQVNTSLRSTIELLFPAETSERRETIAKDTASQKILQQFQQDKDIIGGFSAAAVTNRQGNNNQQRQIKGCLFVTGALIIAFVMLIRWLIGAAGEDIALKPVRKWSTDDVATWIQNLGSWAQYEYQDKFRDAGVNGQLLLVMDEQGLLELSVTSQLHRKAFIEALGHLKTDGVRLATNLWEYKTAHRQHTMWLTICLTGFPRLLIIYSYFCNYEDTYLPFIHYVIPPSDTDPNSDIDETLAKLGQPSWRQSIDFWFRALVIPYYLIGSFMWSWIGVHFWIGVPVVVYSAIMTLTDALRVAVFNQHPSLIGTALKQNCWQFAFWWVVMATVWHITPFFICDIAFYWMIFMSPINACLATQKTTQALQQ